MKLIIFDYDGVIMDTLPALIRIYKDTSDAFSLNLPSHEEFYRDLLELDWRRTLAKLNITSKKDVAKQESIYLKGLKKYDSIIHPYPKIMEILEEFSKRYVLAIVSNAYKSEINYRLEKHSLANYFRAIFTPEDGELKPSPDLLLKCMKKLGIPGNDTFFIGDMDGDIVAGKAAKVNKVIAVTYGFHMKHRLQDADVIIDSPSELLNIL